MIILTILIIIILLFLFLLMISVGVDIGYCEGELKVYFRISAFTFCVYPVRSDRNKKTKKRKLKDKQNKKSFPDVTKDEILDAISVAVRSVKKLKFHLHRLKLHFISAFDDPYQTVMIYGYASAALNAFALPQLKQSDVQLGVDFEREEYYFDGYLSVTIKIYYIMKLLCCLIVGMIPILLRRQKRIKAKDNSCAVKGKVA